jgi:DNA-binding SARP family transcriptional activator/WD40 repeat protein
MDIRILGTLEALEDGRPLAVEGAKQRALLALLVIHANQPLATERLIDELWGERPPASAAKAVQIHVSRLRRALDQRAANGGGLLVTRERGYELRIDPERIDSHRFERLTGEGGRELAAGRPERAVALLEEAMSLWRGPPLAEFAYERFAQAEILRLEELHVGTLEELIEAKLALGRHAEVVAPLERLITKHPYRERLRAQLMLALFRCERQADALQAYQDARRALVEELGIEPSQRLRELERSILEQDASLVGVADASRARAGLVEVCPFKGLAVFDRGDAEYFCGRERLVSELLARLVESTLVGILGPSGIGKSSLLRAGVLPALGAGVLPGSGSWRQLLLRPGEHPCAELQRALEGEPLASVFGGLSPGGRVVVAVDQLEELFTVCGREEERAAFLGQLAEAARDRERRALVVCSLRADFYGRLASYPAFAGLVSASHVLVGPMDRDELARAIEQPAARAGLEVERTLVDALVADVAGEPGGLPLLSTTLLELWRTRDGRALRYERYSASGGVRGAVARLAEAAYTQLDTDERRIARGVMLRLAGGEEGALVRRRVPLTELERADGAERVLATLIDARLLTVADGEVELSHEALLREWPRYQAWLEEDRAGRRLHAHLTRSAREWDASGRDPGELYRGARLSSALEWAAHHEEELRLPEQRFLDAGRRYAARATRRLYGVLIGVGLLLIAAAVAGAIALIQKRYATAEARVALARQLGAEALNQPRLDLAMLLAREAVNLDPSPQTEGTLLATLQRSPAVIGTLALAVNAQLQQLAVSPDGRTLAVGTPFVSLRLYDLRTHAPQRSPVADYAQSSQPPVYSRDGSLLAYSAYNPALNYLEQSYIAVRDAHTLALRARLAYLPVAPGGGVSLVFQSSVLIAPDGRTVYFAYSNTDSSGNPGAAYLDSWSLPSGRPVLARARIGYGGLLAARLVDAGARLIVVWPGSVSVFDSRSLRRLRTVPFPQTTPPPGAPPWVVVPAAISPDGGTVVIGSQTGRVSFVDLSSGRVRTGVGGHGALVSNVVYSPDGQAVTTTGNDGKVIVWNPKAAAPIEVLTGPAAQAGSAALSADGKTLYTDSLDGVVLEWDLAGDRSFGRRVRLGPGLRCCGPVSPPAPPLAVSPDGSRFAVRLGASTVGLFSARTLQREAVLTVGSRRAAITALAWSPSAPELAVGGYSGLLQLWNVAAAPRLTRTLVGLHQPFKGVPEAIQSAAFSPNGRLLAASDKNSCAGGAFPADLEIWRASTGKSLVPPPQTPGPPCFPASPTVLAFSPNGRLLAAANSGQVNFATQVLDPSTLQARRTLPTGGFDYAISLAFAPGGTLATGTAGGTVRLWNPTSNQTARFLAAATPITSIAFDATGQGFATTGAQDGTVKLWFTPTLRQEGAALATDRGATSTVAFEPNSGNLLVVDDHGNAFTWPTSPAAWQQRACAIAGRNLTHQEWAQFVPGQSYAKVCP